jgi:hypothetical protein
MSMSSSEPTTPGDGGSARLDLASRNTMLEITIVGPDFRPVASGVGTLQTDVAPGIYQIVTRAGPTVERKLVSLAAGQTHTAADLWVSFPSAAPVAGTTTTHEYHEELAREVTRRAQQATTASWLAVIVRDVRGHDGPPLEVTTLSRLAILDPRMEPVPEPAGGWELRDRDAVAAWSGGLPPGPYLLRTDGAEGPIDQALWLMRGWQTVVFLTVGPSGPDTASASVHMVDMGLEWSPYEDRAAEAAELGSWALREGRSVVPHDMLDLLLNRKFRNPMFGLIGAHALLLQPTVDDAELSMILTNLGSLIPDHPDLAALRWMAEERRAAAAGEAPVVPPGVGDIHWPPMLLASYQALLRMDAEDPGALRDGSVAERVAANLTVEGIWTAWRPVSPDAEEPAVGAPPPPMPADRPTAAPPAGAPPRSIGLPRLPWGHRGDRRVETGVRGRGVDGAAWQPELEAGEVLAGLAPSIGTLVRRRYRDPATARVARYLANVSELEGPKWAGARFAEITIPELARATQLPTATVDRSVRELRLLATTLSPPPTPPEEPPQPQPQPKPRPRRPRRDTNGGGMPPFLASILVAIGLLLLLGLGAVVGMAVFNDETPVPSPSPTPSDSPSPSASATPTATATASPSPTPGPTPIAIGIPQVDPLELPFGEVVIGFDAVYSVTVSNVGRGTLRVAPSTLRGESAGDYATDDGCANAALDPGAWCTIGVRFAPVGFDARLADLVIEPAGHEPTIVPLVGFGLPESPPFIDPPAFDFVVAPAVDVAVVATGPVVIADVSIEGEYAFSYAVNEEACEVTLAAADIACVVTVVFIGDFVSCETVQPAELVFTTASGARYPVPLQTTWIC